MDLFMKCLENAINGKVKCNFGDCTYGVPVEKKYDSVANKLTILVDAYLHDGERCQGIKEFVIDYKQYPIVKRSNSVFTENIQEFYFEDVEESDYFVIVFGC